MKNCKGVSMITLIITIIVIIILSSVAIVVSNNGIDMANEAKFQNEKREIKQALTSRFAGYLRNEDLYPIEGIALQSAFNEGLSDEERKQQVLNEIVTHLKGLGRYTVDTDEVKNEIEKMLQDNINHIEYTRIIGATEMLALGLTNVGSEINYEYVVNYYSSDVIGPIN